MSLNAGQASTITVQALDTQGGPISNPGTFSFTSQNTTIAEVTTQGAVLAIRSGNTTIAVSLSRGGITKNATVTVTVSGTLPGTATVAAGTATNTFQPQNVVVGVGGSVTWSFGSLEHNVTFSGGGAQNIPNSINTTAARSFNAAGNFPYDCTLHAGMNGTVHVR